MLLFDPFWHFLYFSDFSAIMDFYSPGYFQSFFHYVWFTLYNPNILSGGWVVFNYSGLAINFTKYRQCRLNTRTGAGTKVGSVRPPRPGDGSVSSVGRLLSFRVYADNVFPQRESKNYWRRPCLCTLCVRRSARALGIESPVLCAANVLERANNCRVLALLYGGVSRHVARSHSIAHSLLCFLAFRH